jgi:hypothetical protein
LGLDASNCNGFSLGASNCCPIQIYHHLHHHQSINQSSSSSSSSPIDRWMHGSMPNNLVRSDLFPTVSSEPIPLRPDKPVHSTNSKHDFHLPLAAWLSRDHWCLRLTKLWCEHYGIQANEWLCS